MSEQPTLVPWIDRYSAERVQLGMCTRKSAKQERYTLYRFAESFGRRPVDRLGRADVERWLGDLEHLRPSSRRTYFSRVQAFCRWLVDRQVIRRDPTSGLRAPRQPRPVPRVFEQWEVVALLDRCPTARDRLAVLLMTQLGLRCVEIARLQLGDFTARHVRVCGKGSHERVLPVLPEVRTALDAYLAERGHHAGGLMEYRYHPGRPIKSNYLSKRMIRLMVAAGVKQRGYDGKSAHGLRRTCATDMLDHGADIIDVADALGHANLATVQKYAKVSARRLEAAMAGRVYTRLSEP